MVKGIDLSDLILKLLLFDIKTLIIGSLDAKTVSFQKTQINKVLIRQNLLYFFLNLSITLFKNKCLICLSLTKSLNLIQI